MDVNYLVKEIADIENGLKAKIYQIQKGYSVSLLDVDSGENVGIFKIFNNVDDATKYAFKITNNRGS